MSIRVGIYDFFAYTVPGGFYIVVLAHISQMVGLITTDFNTIDFSFVQVILFAGSAYLLGLIVDPIAAGLWARFFRPNNIPELVLKKFKDKHEELDIRFKSTDWPILLAYIAKENIEMLGEIQRHNATQKMLRNISFGLLIFALAQTSQLFFGFSLWQLVLAVISLIFSVIAMKQSVRINRWFYSATYEAAVAYSLDMSALVSIKRGQNSETSQKVKLPRTEPPERIAQSEVEFDEI